MPKGVYVNSYNIQCIVCSKEFCSQRKIATYCSNLCRNIKWRSENRDQDKSTKQRWIENNPKQHLNNQSSYQSNRCKSDPIYLLKRRLRARLGRISLRKGISHIRELSCSITFLKTYLESMFYGGMTWENYGEIWEIDHREALVNAKTKEELIKLCSYTNLQPLSVEDHILKTSKENSNV